MLTKHTLAHQKACPLLMLSPRENQTGMVCMGASCMLWRWAEHPPIRKFWPAKNPEATEPEGKRPTNGGSVFVWSGYTPGDDDGAGWVETEESAAARRMGFCGLGGEPRDEP
jgi:hypothetical protein